MTPTQQHATLATASGEMVFDKLTRTLYATDASHHEIEPLAVGFSRSAREAASMIQAAAAAGISVTPRGGGTGLVGGALGEGLVIDFARHNREIGDFDLAAGTVQVGAGVVLDQLNQFLKPHGYCFGPDVATSSRATIGGMIANNSSGARTAHYGTTADHVVAVEIVLADGSIAKVGPARDALAAQRVVVEDIAALNGLLIAEQFPPGLLKRLPGYALDRIARDPGNLINVLAGSEGTLAGIVSAELKVVPLPKTVGVGLVFFATVGEALQAAVAVQDLQPVAVEHIDRILIDQTRGQREFQAARDLLDFDARPCEAVLAVEFYGEVKDKLAALERKKLGLRTRILETPAQIAQFWALRKAGLSLLTSRRGDAKPVTCIEDTAVRVKDLPAYYEGLCGILRRLNLPASFYGHAGAGLMHVRPVLDLHSPDDREKFRQVTAEVVALVRQFQGSFCAEHGVGLARTEFLKAAVGEPLYQLMREIKAAFDPHRLFNPGKLIGDGRYKLDTHLRRNLTEPIQLPFEPVFAFAAQDESFVANLEQCNGCGGCRKDAPTMCPTFIATGDELMSTRGRANVIRTALGHAGFASGDALVSPELAAALDHCLGCRACVNECPSQVNLPLLKAELQAARSRRDGVTFRQRIFSGVDKLGALGCRFPWLANMVADSYLMRQLLARVLGLAPQRQLLHYAAERFDVWFARRADDVKRLKRGRVILWDDTFVRYHEPHVGRAAVRVLEAAGFEVILPTGRECCGRPAFSQGHLTKAAKLGRHNLEMLHVPGSKIPIIFLEPSCHSMFAEDYREMNLPGAAEVARRCVLFEQFIDDLLHAEPGALRFTADAANVVVHAHCHSQAIVGAGCQHRLAARLPGRRVTHLDTGCCGMAGAFGMQADKYELSMQVAAPLAEKLKAQPFGTVVIASGTSCRQQIASLAPVRPRHMAEVLAAALVGS